MDRIFMSTRLILPVGGLMWAGSAAAAEDAAPVNMVAIGMFLLFALVTLGITWWAARRTRSAHDFYAAGGGITGLQNGLAIAGD